MRNRPLTGDRVTQKKIQGGLGNSWCHSLGWQNNPSPSSPWNRNYGQLQEPLPSVSLSPVSPWECGLSASCLSASGSSACTTPKPGVFRAHGLGLSAVEVESLQQSCLGTGVNWALGGPKRMRGSQERPGVCQVQRGGYQHQPWGK